MKSVRFHDSKLKLVKALLFRLFHETEAPTAGFCSAFICGRAYCTILLGSLSKLIKAVTSCSSGGGHIQISIQLKSE